MPVPFNTHEVVQELQGLGFPREQAEGLTDVLLKTAQTGQEHLATKADLQEVKAELKADIAGVRTDMEKMRGEVKAEIATVRTEIQAAKNSALMWTIGVLGSLYILGFGLLYTLLARMPRP
jgi:hypothetical protein